MARDDAGSVSRRGFLIGAAGAAGAASAVSGLGAVPARAASRSRLTAAGPAGMPSIQELWAWEEHLVRFGTRYTGSPGHAAYVDWLAGQLSAIKGFTLRTDRLTFNRWLARHYGLRVSVPAAVGASGSVPVTYYYPGLEQQRNGQWRWRAEDRWVTATGSSGVTGLRGGRMEHLPRAWAYVARQQDRRVPGGARRVRHAPGPAACR